MMGAVDMVERFVGRRFERVELMKLHGVRLSSLFDPPAEFRHHLLERLPVTRWTTMTV